MTASLTEQILTAMPATIDATVGGAAANSYLTIAAADAIVETVPGTTAWATATTDQKTRALITALQGKWGLTAILPSNHPYKTVGPTP
jgi:hypothetical protein